MAEYGKRANGTPKGRGYFGEIKMKDGSVMTELGVNETVDGEDVHYPLIHPGISREDLDYLAAGKKPTGAMYDAALGHAMKRRAAGRDPFAGEDDEVMPMPEPAKKFADGGMLDQYRALKKEYPAAYTAAAILPVTGQAMAVADYADAMDRGDTGDGIMAAASLIPGIKLAKLGSKIAPAAHELAIAKTFDPKSARAVLAPMTANSGRIGKVAAAEQLGEYADNKVSEYAMRKAEHDAKNRQDNEAYSMAWHDVVKQ